MNVEELMRRNVRTCSPNDVLQREPAFARPSEPLQRANGRARTKRREGETPWLDVTRAATTTTKRSR